MKGKPKRKKKRLGQSYSDNNNLNSNTYTFISNGSKLMGRREREYNKHHWCPSSRMGDTNDLNCEYILRTTHDAIHTLFANGIFPEQIEKLTDMTSRVLLPEIQKELLEWINSRDIHNPEERYKEGALLLPKKYRHG